MTGHEYWSICRVTGGRGVIRAPESQFAGQAGRGATVRAHAVLVEPQR